MHDDGVVGLRGEHRALVSDTFIYIRGGVEGIAQRQLTLVVAHVIVSQFQFHTSQRQESHAVRPLEEVFVEYGVGGLLFACEDRVAYGLQMGLGLKTVIVVGRTTPEGLLVQLYLLFIRLAVDHRSQVGVPYGQCLEPVAGGTAVPETVVLGVCGH